MFPSRYHDTVLTTGEWEDQTAVLPSRPHGFRAASQSSGFKGQSPTPQHVLLGLFFRPRKISGDKYTTSSPTTGPALTLNPSHPPLAWMWMFGEYGRQKEHPTRVSAPLGTSLDHSIHFHSDCAIPLHVTTLAALSSFELPSMCQPILGNLCILNLRESR